MGLEKKGEESGVVGDKLYYKANHISFNVSDMREINLSGNKETPIIEKRLNLTINSLGYQSKDQREKDINFFLGGGWWRWYSYSWGLFNKRRIRYHPTSILQVYEKN